MSEEPLYATLMHLHRVVHSSTASRHLKLIPGAKLIPSGKLILSGKLIFGASVLFLCKSLNSKLESLSQAKAAPRDSEVCLNYVVYQNLELGIKNPTPAALRLMWDVH